MASYKNPAIAAVIQDQQLERLNFASGLRADPAGYSAFQQKNIAAIVSDVTNRKQSAFQKAQIDLGRYMDMQHNVNFYKTRSGDVADVTSVMLENNNKIEDQIRRDNANSRRQFEINEWYNYNKLETLFFLQVVFMSSLAAAIVMYLTKKGMITVGFAGTLYGILGLFVLCIGVYKYFYTEGARDVKLWHRRRFQNAAAPPSPSCPDVDGSYFDELQKAISSASNTVETCAGNINQDLTAAAIGASAQLADIESGKATLGDFLASELNSVCGKR